MRPVITSPLIPVPAQQTAQSDKTLSLSYTFCLFVYTSLSVYQA